MDFIGINDRIAPLDEKVMAASKNHWDSTAKPIESLGIFEQAISKIAGLVGQTDVRVDKRALLLMCADNGVVDEGVTQIGSDITRLVADNAAVGKSTVCLMAKQVGCEVLSVDMGMAQKPREAGVIDRRIASGTQNIAKGPAMTREQALEGIQKGMDLVKDLVEKGYQLILTGEMGIGNTTTSSAIASVLLEVPVELVTGRGAGLTREGIHHKIEVIHRAIAVNAPDPKDGLDVLAKLGGFDIAGLVGVMIGGALYRIPVLVDGIITSVAALIATMLVPNSDCCLLASHVSDEPCGTMLLRRLNLKPVITAELCLGEGTGAMAALPLLDLANMLYHKLPSFDELGMEAYERTDANNVD